MYNYDEELNIAKAVAQKSFETDGLPMEEALKKRHNIYHQTLQNRAVRFLQEMDQKLDSLQNQEIANLLKSLLASGLNIENEEELEYWITLLTNLAMARLSQFLSNQSVQNPSQQADIKNLLQSVIMVYQHRRPSPDNVQQYAQWQTSLENMKKFEKILQKGIDRQKSPHQPQRKNSNKNRNNSQESYRNSLQSKMSSAGVPSGGEYWNEVMSSFEASMDVASFVENWSADNARIDAEKNSKTSEYDKLSELRGLSGSDKKQEDENNRHEQENENSKDKSENSMGYLYENYQQRDNSR